MPSSVATARKTANGPDHAIAEPFDLEAFGKTHTFIVNCAPVLGAKGKPGGALVSLEDVTQLEENKIELGIAKERA